MFVEANAMGIGHSQCVWENAMGAITVCVNASHERSTHNV